MISVSTMTMSGLHEYEKGKRLLVVEVGALTLIRLLIVDHGERGRRRVVGSQRPRR